MREFEGSVAQTFICRGRRGERWFQRWFGWTRGSTILPWISSFLFFSMWCHLNLCNMLGEILNDWLLSLRVLPHTYSCTCFIQENKNGNKQGLYRFSNTGESKPYWIKKIIVWNTKFYFIYLYYFYIYFYFFILFFYIIYFFMAS